MSIRRVCPRLGGAVVIACFGIGVAGTAAAQASSPDASAQQHAQRNETPGVGAAQTGHERHTMPPDQHAGHDMAAMEAMARDGSGTAWQPDSTPMYALHADKAGWMLMAHLNALVQVLHDSGERGQHQFGSINWFMGMADRKVGLGRVGLRGMVSIEPWTIGGCGYPDLLATGERCNGQKIHDRQHPHDLVMELAAEYRRAPTGFHAVAGLRRPCRRAGPWPGGLTAPSLSHAESAGANLPPLARCDTYHVRCRDRRSVRESLEGRRVGVQRA